MLLLDLRPAYCFFLIKKLMRFTIRALLFSIWSLLIASTPVSALGIPHAQARPSASTLSGKLPAQVRTKLQRARIPLSAVSILVTPLDQATPLVALNARKSMYPASTMKLVTTFAGLSMLGPQFRWHTSAYTDGVIEDGTLQGNLYIRGTGDPKLVPETLIQFVEQIHQAGITSINGDLVLDKAYFDPSTRHLSSFDRTASAPYNVGPDALLYAFKSLIFTLTPQINEQIAIEVKPALTQLQVVNTLQANPKPCNVDLRARARTLPAFTQQANGMMHAVFTGSYPLRCGIHDIAVAATLDHTSFFSGGFLALWQQTGGTFKGRVREARVPTLARLITVYKGLALTDIVRDINKFSNNTMARNLFLTIDASHNKTPATTIGATRTIKNWLAKNRLAMPELVLENGSGLSRRERISAHSMATLLRRANTSQSEVAQAFMTSLPIVGVDGTMRERLTYRPIAGNARIKTGTLDKVRAIAGYVVAKNGRTYAVVSFINHPRAQDGQAAHDALLEWVYQQAR